MLTLNAITRGILDGRHQHYPTPHIDPRPVDAETADETAVRMLRAYHSISYLRLVDESGAEVREYHRHEFAFSNSPLWDVHCRVVDADIAERMRVRSA
ncbi:hypothetical protein ACFZC6_01665 [Streptomyces ossamyceticus]|uniref:hypothetical protein n=1 Tax=Streptomyces ossamyceticus TaxID=249581 RepID=UPI0036ED37D8